MNESEMNPDNRQADLHAQADHPDRVAIFPDGVSASYEEAAATALSTALATVGVRAQERVLIVLPDGSGFEEAIISAIRLAAVPLPVNPWVSADDLVTVTTETDARLVVVSAERTNALADLPVELKIPVHGPQGVWATVLLLGPTQVVPAPG